MSGPSPLYGPSRIEQDEGWTQAVAAELRDSNMYTTALVVGRAFALANSHQPGVDDPARDLWRLAAGDRVTLSLAQERFEVLLRRRPTPEDRKAFDLLGQALAIAGDAERGLQEEAVPCPA
jgi:hypothetical protein